MPAWHAVAELLRCCAMLIAVWYAVYCCAGVAEMLAAVAAHAAAAPGKDTACRAGHGWRSRGAYMQAQVLRQKRC